MRMRTGLLAVFSLILSYSATAETLEFVDKVEAAKRLFYYITQPVPNLKIVANIETHETPWTEDQIRQTVAGAHFDHDLILHPQPKSKIQAVIRANIESLRKQHSGTNFIRVCEWIGPGVYRRDLLAMDGEPITNSFKSGTNVKYIWANIYDRTFSDYVSWRANPLTGGATISKDKTLYVTDDLWESMVIAPEDAFGFMLLVKDGQKTTLSPEATWLNGSLAPLRSRLSEPRLGALVAGSDPLWSLDADLSEVDKTQCVILSLKSKEGAEVGITYVMDWPSQRHLLKVVRSAPSENVLVTTTRRFFDTNGIPREWITEGRTQEKPIIYKKVSIVSAEVNPKWDLQSVFAPVFAKNYIVDEVTAGVSRNIQWGSALPKPSIIALNKSKLFGILFLAANIAVLFGFYIHWKKARTSS